MNRWISGLVVLALVAGLGVTAEASLVVNGSFEGTGNIATYTTLAAPSTAINGWTVTSGSIDWIGGYWTAQAGNRSLDLAGSNANGVIVGQTFATVVGQTYEVAFWMAGNPDRLTTKYLSATVTDATDDSVLATQNFSFTNTAATTKTNMGWTEYSLVFIAESTSTKLTFTSLNAVSWGAALDNVSVTAVPEPATLAIWSLFGAVGMTATWRRRRRAA